MPDPTPNGPCTSVMETVMPVAEAMEAVMVMMPEADEGQIAPEASVAAIVPMTVPVTMTIAMTMACQQDKAIGLDRFLDQHAVRCSACLWRNKYKRCEQNCSGKERTACEMISCH